MLETEDVETSCPLWPREGQVSVPVSSPMQSSVWGCWPPEGKSSSTQDYVLVSALDVGLTAQSGHATSAVFEAYDWPGTALGTWGTPRGKAGKVRSHGLTR